MVKRWFAFAAAATAAGLIMACAKVELAPHLRPLSSDTMMLLGKKGMAVGSPIFVRVFKEESELELWKQREDGRFYHFKTYPICNWSGELGPKVVQGDLQAPEGFYTVNQHQMNPNSQFHLAFNVGYPNAFDRANKRTGSALMVHGKCKSAGCYAMTDALIEEIYALAREAFIAGQESFHVHAFPFRMTAENLARHKDNPNARFWSTLKEGYDHFEVTRQTPAIAVCERRYVVNAKPKAGQKLNPEGACPPLERDTAEPFTPLAGAQTAEIVVVNGPKLRAANAGSGAASSGMFSLGLGGSGKASSPSLSFSN